MNWRHIDARLIASMIDLAIDVRPCHDVTGKHVIMHYMDTYLCLQPR